MFSTFRQNPNIFNPPCVISRAQFNTSEIAFVVSDFRNLPSYINRFVCVKAFTAKCSYVLNVGNSINRFVLEITKSPRCGIFTPITFLFPFVQKFASALKIAFSLLPTRLPISHSLKLYRGSLSAPRRADLSKDVAPNRHLRYYEIAKSQIPVYK